MKRVYKYNDKTKKMYEVKQMRPLATYHMVMPDMPDYISPVTRKLVSGRTQRREDLLRAGCRAVDPSEKSDFMRGPAPQEDFDFTRDNINEVEARLGHRIGDYK